MILAFLLSIASVASAQAPDPSELDAPTSYQQPARPAPTFDQLGPVPPPPQLYTGPIGAQQHSDASLLLPPIDGGAVRATRVVLNYGIGVLAAFLGFITGGFADILTGCWDFDDSECRWTFPAFVGVSVSLAVFGGGDVLDGNGNALATAVGGGLGTALASYLFFVQGDGGIESFWHGIALLSMPTVGAILGYELTSDDSALATRRAQQASVTAAIAPSPTGASVVVYGRF